MAQFMILMFEDDDAWAGLSEGTRDALLKRYYAWVAQLRSESQLVDGDPIGRGGVVLRAEGSRIHSEVYAAQKEVLTGYFKIEARDMEHATEIARGCPALRHGEMVMVRPIGHG